MFWNTLQPSSRVVTCLYGCREKATMFWNTLQPSSWVVTCFFGCREKATMFWNTLQPVAKEFDNIESLQLSDAEVSQQLNICYPFYLAERTRVYRTFSQIGFFLRPFSMFTFLEGGLLVRLEYHDFAFYFKCRVFLCFSRLGGPQN